MLHANRNVRLAVRVYLAVVCGSLLSVQYPLRVSAQELPASVASGLVDRALADRIEVSAPERSQGGIWPTATIVGVLLLMVTIVVKSKREAFATGLRTDDMVPESDDVGRARARHGGSGAVAGEVHRPTSAPTLTLPPHVLEIMARARLRHREDVLATARPEAGEVAAEADSVRHGIDIVLPRFDPRNGR